jgi:hypothetical protein
MDPFLNVRMSALAGCGHGALHALGGNGPRADISTLLKRGGCKMFAPKVAKPQTKAAIVSTSRLADPRSTLTAQRHGPVEQWPRSLTANETGGDYEKEVAPEILTARDALRGVSWDFSKIPVFPPNRVSRPQPSSPLAASPLPGAIQAKLVVGEVNDPLEHEADRIADQVMRIPNPAPVASAPPSQVTPKGTALDEEEVPKTLRIKPFELSSRIHDPGALGSVRQAGDEQSNKKREVPKRLSPSESKKERRNESDGTPPLVHKVLGSSGQPLDVHTRGFVESRFGLDFSHIRVHTDAEATESAQAVNALAYTVGEHVVFGPAQYAPATHTGRRLLSHELVHTLQQRGQGIPPSDSFAAPPNVDEFEIKSELGARAGSVYDGGSGINEISPVTRTSCKVQRQEPDVISAGKVDYLPDYSQGDLATCGAASVISALMIWDREKNDPKAPNNMVVNAIDLLLRYMVSSSGIVAANWKAKGKDGDKVAIYVTEHLTKDDPRFGPDPRRQIDGSSVSRFGAMYVFNVLPWNRGSLRRRNLRSG